MHLLYLLEGMRLVQPTKGTTPSVSSGAIIGADGSVRGTFLLFSASPSPTRRSATAIFELTPRMGQMYPARARKVTEARRSR